MSERIVGTALILASVAWLIPAGIMAFIELVKLCGRRKTGGKI